MAFANRFPLLPLEKEACLSDMLLRENSVERGGLYPESSKDLRKVL